MTVNRLTPDGWRRLDPRTDSASQPFSDQDYEDLAHESARILSVRRVLMACVLLGFSIYELLEIDTEEEKEEEEFAVTLEPAEYVRMIRTNAQFSQAELDVLIGLDAGFIASVESGQRDLLDSSTGFSLDIAEATHTSRYRMFKVLEHAFTRA